MSGTSARTPPSTRTGRSTTREGSWEAGRRRCAARDHHAGRPGVGTTYRQEFYAGEAEDQATVVELGATPTRRPAVRRDVLVTEDWTPLEPDVRSASSDAPGVGLVHGAPGRAAASAMNDLTEFAAPD